MNLAGAEQINHATGVVFRATLNSISVSGQGGSTSVFQLYTNEVKNKKINAINIRVRTYSGYSVINTVEVWDDIVRHEMHSLCLSSNDEATTDYDLKIGLSKKPRFQYGMLLRIEVFFQEKYWYQSAADPNLIRQIDFTQIDIEVIPNSLPDSVHI